MKTCVIMQPTYLPWLGYFDLIKSSDVFVFLDHVQFSKQSWQQRNKIRDKNGEQILTIATLKGSTKETMIKDVLIDQNKIPLKKHLKTIKNNYAKAKNFKTIFAELEEIYSRDYTYLATVNMDLIAYGCQKMGITPSIVQSSDLDISLPKVEGIIEICKQVDADHYLSPVGAKEYIEENNIFDANNIALSYQEYTPPTYTQINYNDFISHLSFIDYLFNLENK